MPSRLAACALLLAWVAAAGACGRTQGPRAIAWDREPCAHCRMLISDPAFAAQLETDDGEHLAFDDPGCLLAYLAEREPRVRALWFHHLREDRWIPGDEVAFAPAETPMAYGLGAVDAGSAGAIGLGEARARVAALDAGRSDRR